MPAARYQAQASIKPRTRFETHAILHRHCDCQHGCVFKWGPPTTEPITPPSEVPSTCPVVDASFGGDKKQGTHKVILSSWEISPWLLRRAVYSSPTCPSLFLERGPIPRNSTNPKRMPSLFFPMEPTGHLSSGADRRLCPERGGLVRAVGLAGGPIGDMRSQLCMAWLPSGVLIFGCILPRDVGTFCLFANEFGFSTKPRQVKLLAGEQKATELYLGVGQS